MTYRFLRNCVATTGDDVALLTAMIDDAIGITRKTFLKHVHRGDLRSLEAALSYDDHHTKGLTMAADWHVSYHRSHWNGERCYYFQHSGIEYYFTGDGGGADEFAPHWDRYAGATRQSIAEEIWS